MSAPLKLIRTTQDNISNASTSNIIDGCIYVATDTGRVFLGMPNDLLELAGIEVGPGLVKENNYLGVNVVDILDASGNSIVDPNGYAHIYSSGGSGSGGTSLNTYYSTIPAGSSGTYSINIPAYINIGNIVSINFYAAANSAVVGTAITGIDIVGNSDTSEYRKLNYDWSICTSTGSISGTKSNSTVASVVLKIHLPNTSINRAIQVYIFYNTDTYVGPVNPR